jgi:hypothetical protein
MALKLNLDSCWGIAEITGPYLWTLSYSSNKGTASSFKFFGTAKYCLSDKGTTNSFLHSWGHMIHKIEDPITEHERADPNYPLDLHHLSKSGAVSTCYWFEASLNKRPQETLCFFCCMNLQK